MKHYTAFLRGINISGKNKIAMPELKAGLEALGFSGVTTYLNSGNAQFSAETDAPRPLIEAMLAERFGLQIPVYVLETDTLREILAHAPAWWGTADKAQYDNLIFILTDETPADIAALIGEPTAGLEQVQAYENVIFWTFDRAKYQKCRWWKQTAAAGITEKLTIRTANTLKKLVCP